MTCTTATHDSWLYRRVQYTISTADRSASTEPFECDSPLWNPPMVAISDQRVHAARQGGGGSTRADSEHKVCCLESGSCSPFAAPHQSHPGSVSQHPRRSNGEEGRHTRARGPGDAQRRFWTILAAVVCFCWSPGKQPFKGSRRDTTQVLRYKYECHFGTAV